MPKNIIICSDGTGNAANKGRGTNVFKLFEAIDLTDLSDATGQIAIYDDGVGTQKLKLARMLGGAFGWGLTRNIRQLYEQLAYVYRPGDNIFIFGFSRGAFTARSLAGFIADCGILNVKPLNNAQVRAHVKDAYFAYRQKYRAWLSPLWNALMFWRWRSERDREAWRKKFAVDDAAKLPNGCRIQFVGVWDTVAAVGLPFAEAAAFLNKVIYGFKFRNQTLSQQVYRACHAIALDEERHTFYPELWDETKDDKKKTRIEQLWFPGVHSNVGGGYPKQGMSLVALEWMMSKAADRDSGIRFVEPVRQRYRDTQNVNDTLYDSRAGLAIYYRYKPRHVREICKKRNVTPKIHLSTVDRIARGPHGYAPGSFPAMARIVTTDGEEWTDLQDVVQEAMAERRDLRDDVRFWHRVRKASHYALVILTGAFLWLGASDRAGDEGGMAFLKGFQSLLTFEGVWGALRSSTFLGLFLIGLFIAYLVGLLARTRMEKSFNRFWHGVREHLHKLLEPAA